MEDTVEVIDLLKPRALQPYVIETEDLKKFHIVSEALNNAGIHGDDNVIETCKALGLKNSCSN